MPADGDLRVNASVTIPSWELGESFVRASGPGGQHVNTTSSAVQLRWNVERSSLPAEAKARVRRRWRTRITGQGDLIVEASAHRSQAMNREAARERLAGMVAEALRPRKRRVPTTPTYGSVKRRLQSKKARGEVKALRGKVERDD